MAWKLLPIFRVLATTYKSTQLFYLKAAVQRTCRVFAIKLSAASMTLKALKRADKAAHVTVINDQRPVNNMRGKPAPKRIIAPDARYEDLEVSKFINYIMHGGKKATAQRIVYDCFEVIKEKTNEDPRTVFNKALKAVSPLLEVRSRRVGEDERPGFNSHVVEADDEGDPVPQRLDCRRVRADER